MLLEVKGPGNSQVAILDGRGRLIAGGRITGAGICRISLKHNAGDVYFARVTAPDGGIRLHKIAALP